MEVQTEERSEEPRDWRGLRAMLLNLKTKDAEAVAVWLRDAGYVCQTVPAKYSNQGDLLVPKRDVVSPEILRWVSICKDVIAWLMGLDRGYFADAVRIAQKSRANILSPKGQRKFVEEVSAPIQLEVLTLHRFLAGFGSAPALHAFFFWDAEGEASVAVDVSSPMEALAVSVHVDRSFTARRWASCRLCGSRFEQKKSTDLYCSEKCKNNFITTRRRQKISLLRQGDTAWRALPRVKHKRLDRQEWILQWAQRRFLEGKIDTAFAKKTLNEISKRKG